MSPSKGLSTSDAQYSICRGTYGAKSWSPQEQQAACDRYQQMTGHQLIPGYVQLILFVLLIVIVTMIVIVAVKQMKKPKTKKKMDKSKFTKKELKSVNRLSTLISLGIVSLIAVIFVVGFLLLQPRNNLTYPDSESNRNLLIWYEAVGRSDPGVCDEINGGINALSNWPRLKSGAGEIITAPTPDLTESQAKQHCRDSVLHSKKLNDN